MDKLTRNAIERATQQARKLLDDEFSSQLEGTFDVLRSGAIATSGGTHLSTHQHFLRDKIVAAVQHKCSAGTTPVEAITDYIRDAAFTTLNRFVALKMLEARQLLQECITKGEQSAGYREFCGMASGVALLPDAAGYRLYIESLFDEFSIEIKVLFDRRDAASVLWPRRQTFEALLTILNSRELLEVWGDDETIGWVYQFFNGGDERKKMREESQAPRNSRELAVRNQFFTPRYVVQFLTDNTLGRIWYEMRGGATSLVDYCDYLVRRAGETSDVRVKKDPRDIKILDPACGSGHFLLYCFDLLICVYEEAWSDTESPASGITGYTLRTDYPGIFELRAALPGLILRHNLHGVDIDPRCAQIAQLALWMRAQRAFRDFEIVRAERPLIRRTNIVIAEPMPGERELLAEFLRELKEDRLEGLLRRALDVPSDRPVRTTKAMADSLAELVGTVWVGMALAGEMGTLLKIERDLSSAIEKGRREWGDRLPLFRAAEFGFNGDANVTLEQAVTREQEDFWARAETTVLHALADYANTAIGAGAARRRLFVEDAVQGFALADLITQRFDVLLTNPPFGDATPNSSSYLEREYYETRLDLFSSFISRLLSLANPGGLVGALTPRDGFFKKTLSGWRDLVLRNHMVVVADLGIGVLDAATVRVAAYVIARDRSQASTRFLDLVDLPDRDIRLKAEVAKPQRTYDVRMSLFAALPLSRFLYWLPPRLWDIFTQEEPLENRACTPRYGLATFNDDRFCRLAFEVAPAEIGLNQAWIFMSKGGEDFPYGGVSNSLVRWENDAAEMAQINRQSNGQTAQTRRAVKYYFQPAVSFSNRSVQFFVRWHPANFAFSMRGPAVIPIAASQAYILGFFNSRLIRALIQMQTASQTYTTGLLKELRWVEPSRDVQSAVERAATEAFELVRRRLATVETDPFFEGLIGSSGGQAPATVRTYFAWRREFVEQLNEQLAALQALIDENIAGAYGVSISDIERCERVEEVEDPQTSFPPLFKFDCRDADALVSYAFGVAVGRWKFRLADHVPALSDPAPERPPAAGPCSESVAITCDDLGQTWDVVSLLRPALERVLPDLRHEDITELESALGNSIRGWVARSFFSHHLGAYSAFGRKSPIYWQLATPSLSYSIWLYIHAADKDTMFRVQNDYVIQKLSHEQRRLEISRAEAGPSPTGQQRRAIEAQDSLVEELRAFLYEVKLVAPLWNPNLNDGVIINFSLLWRLVPQHRAWQRELLATWEALCDGQYDWAHLAMHLWPERVVEKCTTDCSLAIAHGLEEVFWIKGDDGKWKPRTTPSRPLHELVLERTSPAVKAALNSLLEAPAASTGGTRGRNRQAVTSDGGTR